MQALHPAAGQSVTFSAALGDSIAVQDPDAAPLQPVWDLTLSASVGTLMLSSTAGLSGSGNGSGSLSFSGSLSAINAALDGLRYTPPPGYQGSSTLSLDAQSEGAGPVQGQVSLIVTDIVLRVTTTADSGPGSLRQAILDSNAASGGINTIDFAIPGQGVRTIAPITPLPPITTSVVIDGTSQLGYAGTPLIAIGGASAASSAASRSRRRMSPFAAWPSSDSRLTRPRMSSWSPTCNLRALTAGLSLLGSKGQVLVQSDGLSASDPEDAIDEHLPAGTYFLEVQSSGAGDFALRTTLTSAASPFQPLPPSAAIALGDFNGDGIPDLATPEGIYGGVGDGTFRAPPVGLGLPEPTADYTAIVAGDFNGDGKLDLALADSVDNTVVVLLGNGNGTFRPAGTYDVGTDPVALVAGDFTGDGKLDLAVADEGNEADFLRVTDPGGVSVLLGNGDGRFQPAIEYEAGNSPDSIVAGDFTGDGKLDLAVADAGGYTYPNNTIPSGVSVLLGNGDGTFQPPIQYNVGTDPGSVYLVAGHFTGGRHVDLAIADNASNTVSILLGNGDGTFQAPRAIATEFDPTDLLAGDFNGDSRLDLATANGDGTISILLGNGDGTFAPQAATPVGYAAIAEDLAAGDFTRDGKLDLAITNPGDELYGGTDPGGVNVLLGNGDGTFQTIQQVKTGLTPTTLVTGDFNGDGKPDLATANGDGTISILLGNGDGTFQSQEQLSLGLPLLSSLGPLVAGDFNGDGRLDLAVLDEGNQGFGGSDPGGVEVLLGNGNGTFQRLPELAVELDPTLLLTGDFNDDGKLDLAVVSEDPQTDGWGITIFLGRGDGTFQPLPIQDLTQVSSAPIALAAGDFTGDGKLDLAVLSQGEKFYGGASDPSVVDVLVGKGDGTFQPLPFQGLAALVDPIALVEGEFTGDGKLDLAVLDGGNEGSGGSHPGVVDVLVGKGDGTFQPLPEIVAGVDPTDLVTGDFTGDGKLDMAVVSDNAQTGAQEITVLLGNGDGTFQPLPAFTMGSSPGLWVAADFNDDGHLDLAATGGGSSDVAILLGNGDGTFAPPAS